MLLSQTLFVNKDSIHVHKNPIDAHAVVVMATPVVYLSLQGCSLHHVWLTSKSAFERLSVHPTSTYYQLCVRSVGMNERNRSFMGPHDVRGDCDNSVGMGDRVL